MDIMRNAKMVGQADALSRGLRYAAYRQDDRALREYNYRKDDRTERELVVLDEYLARNTSNSELI